mgnify:CR=1 FL=1
MHLHWSWTRRIEIPFAAKVVVRYHRSVILYLQIQNTGRKVESNIIVFTIPTTIYANLSVTIYITLSLDGSRINKKNKPTTMYYDLCFNVNRIK